MLVVKQCWDLVWKKQEQKDEAQTHPHHSTHTVGHGGGEESEGTQHLPTSLVDHMCNINMQGWGGAE